MSKSFKYGPLEANVIREEFERAFEFRLAFAEKRIAEYKLDGRPFEHHSGVVFQAMYKDGQGEIRLIKTTTRNLLGPLNTSCWSFAERVQCCEVLDQIMEDYAEMSNGSYEAMKVMAEQDKRK